VAACPARATLLMRVTGWIIGCGCCPHAALARLPLAEARRMASRQGWQHRQKDGQRVWTCCYCTGARLASQPGLPPQRERKAS
jgi:hypothetical protein